MSKGPLGHTCLGWEVVCPDGLVRFYPFHNEDDARSEATALSNQEEKPPGHDGRPGCSPWLKPSDLELQHPPCGGGRHTVRPIPFLHGSSERGVS